jgi:hypothetical protein
MADNWGEGARTWREGERNAAETCGINAALGENLGTQVGGHKVRLNPLLVQKIIERLQVTGPIWSETGGRKSRLKPL